MGTLLPYKKCTEKYTKNGSPRGHHAGNGLKHIGTPMNRIREPTSGLILNLIEKRHEMVVTIETIKVGNKSDDKYTDVTLCGTCVNASLKGVIDIIYSIDTFVAAFIMKPWAWSLLSTLAVVAVLF